jgi:hypothetical protein
MSSSSVSFGRNVVKKQDYPNRVRTEAERDTETNMKNEWKDPKEEMKLQNEARLSTRPKMIIGRPEMVVAVRPCLPLLEVTVSCSLSSSSGVGFHESCCLTFGN